MNNGLMPFLGHIANGCRVFLNNVLNIAEPRCLMAPRIEAPETEDNFNQIMSALDQAQKVLSDFSGLMFVALKSSNQTTFLEPLVKETVSMFQLSCFPATVLSVNGSMTAVNAPPKIVMEIILGFLFEAWRDIDRLKDGVSAGCLDVSVEPIENYGILRLCYPVSRNAKDRTEKSDLSGYLDAIGGFCFAEPNDGIRIVSIFFPVAPDTAN